MPAQFTNDSLVATTNVAPVSGASIWRWLVLLPRKWAQATKVARDTEMLRNAPRELLDDIGIARSDVAFICEHGRAPR
ncbi:hypothetical protein ACTU44_19605 [Thalassospira sp. SM2505]|uniref:DUF1127 domain-containing protein n=1 Tax=Thalassospira profundimaris TaxID=502049 RepID=A0A367WWL1_9PROT|nr:hypothetical protein [Thalassospira profundimaris]RCK45778.1 hypothetical protein TH30_11595 [Thalassospira profundimaris]